MFWSQNTKWQRAKEKQILSQIQNGKTLKINGTLKMKTGIRARTFWHRFVAILTNKIVVLEALKIERQMKFDSFVNNIQLQVRKRQV